MQNEINRQFNIGDSFYLKSDNADGQKYTVIGIEDDNRVVFERADSWMFTAVNPIISDNNYVEWDYSVGGRFTDERRVQEHYNKTHSLQKFIDTGKIENIVVYNKYGDFLAEGDPRELRKNELWNLLDEQNAVVKETFHGITGDKQPATCVVLSNFPWKDRSRAELQAQLTSILENADLTDIIDDELRNERTKAFNMRVNKYREHIDSARFAEQSRTPNVKAMSDTELIEHFLEKSMYLTDMPAYEEMKYRNLISKDDTFSTLRKKLDYYNGNPQFESEVMKKFTLVIDISAASNDENRLYVYEADTLQEAKNKLAELNFAFETGKIYCATIGERNNGTLNRYRQIERTDDGLKWYADDSDGHEYIPFEWKRLDDLQNIGQYQKYDQLADKSQGETIIHKTYNSQFAEKVCKQLSTDGVKWNAKVEANGKTVIAVNKKDAEKLDNCAEKAKPHKAQTPDISDVPEVRMTARKK